MNFEFTPIHENIDKYPVLWRSYPSEEAVIIERYELIDKIDETTWKYDVFSFRYYIHTLVKFKGFPFTDLTIYEKKLTLNEIALASDTLSPFFASYAEVINYTLSMISDEIERLKANIKLYEMMYELTKTQLSMTELKIQKYFQYEKMNSNKIYNLMEEHNDKKIRWYRKTHHIDDKQGDEKK